MDDLTHFIDDHADEAHTLGPVAAPEIKAAEAELGHSLPSTVQEYLKRYGALTYGSVEFYGLGMRPSSHLHMVQRTLELRRDLGLPADMVLLEDLGDGHFAVFSTDGTVMEWGSPSYVGAAKAMATSLEAYMLERLRVA